MIVAWLDELSLAPHLHQLVVAFLALVKLWHIGSIALWLWVWYRQVRRNPQAAKAEMLLLTTHKSTLIKEDKCISAGVCANNLNLINQRRPWQYALYLVTISVSLSFMWMTYSLRFDQCNTILKSSHVVEL